MALEMNGIVGGDRGAEPQGWKHATVTPAISFTWHHTIPWNCLLAVWNGMVRGGHWKAVNEFLQLTGGSSVGIIIEQLNAQALTIDRDALHTQLTSMGTMRANLRTR
jgi:hypothetical protein